MKYCPECDSDFPDSDRFCELDGTPLVPAEPVAVPNPDTGLKMTAIAVGGVVIGVMLFLIYYAMTREPEEQSSKISSSNSSVVMQQAVPLFPSVPSPVASPNPSVEPSPVASPSPSVEPSSSPSATETSSSSPQTERHNELTAGAISTLSDENVKTASVLIRLTDGARIEAEEAWQTGEGIWYRRGGVITLLNPKHVKAIERVTPTSLATPQPSPSQSPPI